MADCAGTLWPLGIRWRWMTEGVDADLLARRPTPTVWSVAEYVDHSADVLEGHGRLLHAMTTTDLPPLPAPVERDASADDPPFTTPFDAVVERLGQNAERYQRLVTRTPADAWGRTATIGEMTADAAWLVRHSVHDAVHHLLDGSRVLRALGASPETAVGSVEGVFASGGGVPKESIPAARVGVRGVNGDWQNSRQHHGRVWQALCLWSADVVDRLRGEGHSIHPGFAGENISLRGLDWSTVRPGVQLSLGGVLCEVSAYATPCKKNAAWFLGRDFNRMSHDREPGISRVYASVLRDGVVRPGDIVVVEPSRSGAS